MNNIKIVIPFLSLIQEKGKEINRNIFYIAFKKGFNLQGGESGNTTGGNKGKGGVGDWGGGYPPSRGEQNLPGENLPEHHFKKKYFNQVLTQTKYHKKIFKISWVLHFLPLVPENQGFVMYLKLTFI